MKTQTITLNDYQRRLAQREMILTFGHAVIAGLETITNCIGFVAGAVAAWFAICILLV